MESRDTNMIDMPFSESDDTDFFTKLALDFPEVYIPMPTLLVENPHAEKVIEEKRKVPEPSPESMTKSKVRKVKKTKTDSSLAPSNLRTKKPAPWHIHASKFKKTGKNSASLTNTENSEKSMLSTPETAISSPSPTDSRTPSPSPLPSPSDARTPSPYNEMKSESRPPSPMQPVELIIDHEPSGLKEMSISRAVKKPWDNQTAHFRFFPANGSQEMQLVSATPNKPAKQMQSHFKLTKPSAKK